MIKRKLWSKVNKFCTDQVIADKQYLKERQELTAKSESLRDIAKRCPRFQKPTARLVTIEDAVDHIGSCRTCINKLVEDPVFLSKLLAIARKKEKA